MKPNFALAAAALTALSACSTVDLGGYTETRQEEIARLNTTDEEHEIEGWCASSCTMRLGLNKVCLHADAELVFHGATRGLVDMRPAPLGDAILALHYPEGELRDWFLDTARHARGWGGFGKSGLEVHEMTGVPLCEV